MNRTAELVGKYFGLQQAGNMMPRIERGDEGTRVLNALRAMIDEAKKEIEAKLALGTIDNWPERAPLIINSPTPGPRSRPIIRIVGQD